MKTFLTTISTSFSRICKMSDVDDITVLAAMVGSSLKKVDKHMLQSSTPASQIDPRRFTKSVREGRPGAPAPAYVPPPPVPVDEKMLTEISAKEAGLYKDSSTIANIIPPNPPTPLPRAPQSDAVGSPDLVDAVNKLTKEIGKINKKLTSVQNYCNLMIKERASKDA